MHDFQNYWSDTTMIQTFVKDNDEARRGYQDRKDDADQADNPVKRDEVRFLVFYLADYYDDHTDQHQQQSY